MLAQRTNVFSKAGIFLLHDSQHPFHKPIRPPRRFLEIAIDRFLSLFRAVIRNRADCDKRNAGHITRMSRRRGFHIDT